MLNQRFLDQRTQLTRALVEIHDARLALRGFLSQQTADAARRSGVAAGREGDDLEAMVEAAVLLGAVQSKAQGYHPIRSTEESVTTPTMTPT
ncbi:DUF6545 domain-containing protein [Phytohabitans kaempferiae]|uniref:DUF6545 domain-containing protein n=1 Tax=Phytohabitans kaempferiae TaxID=1620943 RepID=A0ABV6M1K5_9ACTN